uniref:Uncharacterized protein n=1 Tax=Spongospora subterranea TaxID=70186 RepID=A0A0H5R0H3_9EUKA|eukprot:CRZ07482.1 hypothetical protein [Spongospora subterranea]
METVLIGKPELRKLGIDPELLLDEILKEASENNITIGPDPHEPADSDRAPIQSKRMTEQDPEYPEPGFDYIIPIGDEDKFETELAIKNMVDRAIKSGIPATRNELTTLVSDMIFGVRVLETILPLKFLLRSYIVNLVQRIFAVSSVDILFHTKNSCMRIQMHLKRIIISTETHRVETLPPP